MELHTAIERASKFTARGKGAPDILRRVRFFPAQSGSPAHVYAYDGERGVVIPVDIDVPDMALDADSMLAIQKDPIAQVYIDTGGATTVIFRSRSGAGYAIGHQSSMGHPMFPSYPQNMVRIPAWNVVQKAFHATLPKGGTIRGHDRPDLECVHFLPDRVEATDSYRMVLVDIETGLEGKVPSDIFKNWPKRVEVSAAFTETHAWFRAGEEMRFARLQKGTFAEGRNLREQFVPTYHDGAWMTLPTKRLHEVVKKAVKTSPLDQVVMSFGIWGVDIKAEQEDGNFEERIDEEIRVEGQIGLAGGAYCEYPTMIVNGKFLDAALKVVETPNVRLCYGGAASPLRIESGGYVEALWPKLV